MVEWIGNIVNLIVDTPNCELASNFGLGQPINLLTNVAYFGAAYLIWKENHERLRWLPVWMMVVGLGSTVHHTWANGLTLLIDGLPIAIFVGLIIHCLMPILVSKPRLSGHVWVILSIVSVGLGSWILDFDIDPTLDYTLIILGLFVPLIIISWQKYPRSSIKLTIAWLLFGAASVAAVADGIICYQLPIGSHFIWHILGAVSMYYLSKYIIEIDQIADRDHL